MSWLFERVAYMLRGVLALVLVSGAALLASSCTSSPAQIPVQNISVFAPPSLQAEVTAIGRSYSERGFGKVDVQILDGSSVVARIRGASETPDVLFTDGPAVAVHLETPIADPPVAWFALFATSPLVVAYQKKTAPLVRGMSWASLLKNPSVGHVDPTSDPEGLDAENAVGTAAHQTHNPTILRVMSDPKDVGPSGDLARFVKSGELDEALVFEDEALWADLSYTAVSASSTTGSFCVTIPKGAPHPAGGSQFIKLFLSSSNEAQLRSRGFSFPSTLTASGNAAKVPAELKGILG
jgi:ABC-type molybdate transport system substrate-binding protein